MKKKNGRIPFPTTRPVRDDDARGCDWPGCSGGGEFRAPKNRQDLRSYHWFCLDHVRAYNKQWNYYAGMSEDEVETDRRFDTVWNRPSWPLGADGRRRRGPRAGSGPFGIHPDYLDDDFGLFDDMAAEAATGKGAAGPHRAALAALGLVPPVTAAEVKSRYKELVKRHHPDANNGDPASEEKFKEISRAYETLKEFFAA